MTEVHPIPTPAMIMPDVNGSDGVGFLPDGRDPAEGPTVQADQHIDAAPPHTDHDAGSNDNISGSVEGAVALALARLAELQVSTLTQGSTIGDTMPLPHGPDTDETILGYVSEPKNVGGLGMGLAAS